MRRVAHVTRADFITRLRSRRLLVVLAAIAYLGYLVNVGSIELAYQHRTGPDTYVTYYGDPTAAFIGLKAALTGSFVVLFGGYYLLTGTLTRDRRLGVHQLAASTPVSDAEYLLGKWLSHVGLVAVVLATLGGATIVNHAVHGVGPVNPVALVGPIFLFGLPLGGLVAGVAILFETTDRLDGTLGNVAYFLVALVALTTLGAGVGNTPSEAPAWLKVTDTVGLLGVHRLLYDSLLAAVPNFNGGLPSFGQVWTDATERYRYTGTSIPAWLYAQRAGLVFAGAILVGASTVTYDRRMTSSAGDGRGFLARFRTVLPSFGTDADAVVDGDTPANVSLTPVERRSAGGFGRLLHQELRMALRGHRWWWYVGAAGLVAIGFLNAGVPRQAFVSVALLWPLFIWSSMGVRPARHGTTAFILSSASPYRQLLTEWVTGVSITLVVVGPAVVTGVGTTEGLLAVAGTAVFVPSLALASGVWSRSGRVFELVYLVLWYVGPLNAVAQLDFAGATTGGLQMRTPLAFGAIGAMALVAAVLKRWHDSTVR